MTVLKALARPVHTAYSAENQDGLFDVTREFSLEMASLESCLREFEQTTDLIYSIESLTREFFTKGDNITEYETHLFQVSIEASFTAAGVDIPSELIVPSFEAAEATAAAKEKVDDKKEGLLKRIFQWLGQKLRAAADWFKKLIGRYKKADEVIEKKVEDLKEKVKTAETKHSDSSTAHAQLGHDTKSKKGAGDRTHYYDVKEKDGGKHGRSDSDGRADVARSVEDAIAEKNGKDVRQPLPKTVKINSSGTGVNADVRRTFTGKNGKPVDLRSHMDKVLSSIGAVVEKTDGFLEHCLSMSSATKDGVAELGDKGQGDAAVKGGQAFHKSTLREAGLANGRLELEVSDCAKVTVVDETRSSGPKIKVRTEYAYSGNLADDLPMIARSEMYAILGLFDKYNGKTPSNYSSKIITKLENGAKVYEEMAAKYSGAGNKADAERLKSVGALLSAAAQVPAQFNHVRYESINGVLQYLNVCVTMHTSGKYVSV